MTSRPLWTLIVTASLFFVFTSPSAQAQMTGGGGGGGGAPTTGAGTGSGTTGTGQGTTSSSAQTLKLTAVSSGSGSATSVPSNSNGLAPWYGDPYSMGMASKYSKGPPTTPTVTFGKSNYSSTTQGAAPGGAQGGGPAGGAAATGATTTAATNYGTQPGVIRNPQYVTVLSDSVPPVVHQSDALFAEIRDVLGRSSQLQNKNAIQVSVNGSTVLLSGEVGSDRERVLVESIVKMTPGVRQVQNQLQVVQTK